MHFLYKYMPSAAPMRMAVKAVPSPNRRQRRLRQEEKEKEEGEGGSKECCTSAVVVEEGEEGELRKKEEDKKRGPCFYYNFYIFLPSPSTQAPKKSVKEVTKKEIKAELEHKKMLSGFLSVLRLPFISFIPFRFF